MNSEQVMQIVHEQIRLVYRQTNNGMLQSGFVVAGQDGGPDLSSFVCTPHVQLAVAGKPHGFNPGLITGYTTLSNELEVVSFQHTSERIDIIYKHSALQLSVHVEMQLIPGVSIIRQTTSVTNEGDQPVTLTHLSSVYMQGLAVDGLLPWYDNRKLKVHYCRQTWEGEGQWRSGDLEELGLYPTSVHPTSCAVHLASEGSWSTGKLQPMIVIEDQETGKSWYAQIETSSNWHIELSHRGTWDGVETGALYLQLDGASDRFGGWAKTLQPGEQFTSVPAAIGCCQGDFTDAVRELTTYRRSILKPAAAWAGEFPVMFNDYMNCLWGNPSRDKLIPLIDAAAGAGVEGFVIDAGWFADPDASWGMGLGDWLPNDARFGPGGLQGILDYIREKGMLPGIWLEVEVCGERAALGKRPDDWFLRRCGERVGGGDRWFLNMTNPEVKQYLHEVIDRLVGMGIGFIKNDYNACIGHGDDVIGDTPADGLMKHIRAFYEFIDEVRARHPQLILENCASGAMREDYGILSHFHIVSTSDQEFYTKNPSIIGGSLAAVLPEQCGFWSFPYPHLFLERDNEQVFTSPEYVNKMKDGEQTVFNMINGMCGILYLSGRIDRADERNQALIREAVALYKQERSFISSSYPFWPIGFTRFNDDHGWASVALAAKDNKRVLLSVWRLDAAEDCRILPLRGWNGKKARVRQIYPSAADYSVDTYYDAQEGTLTVRLPKRNQARLFEITEM